MITVTVRYYHMLSRHSGLACERLERPEGMGVVVVIRRLPTPLAPHITTDQLLLWRNPGDPRGVMCAGNWLLWDVQVVGHDPEAIRERAAAAAARLWQV